MNLSRVARGRFRRLPDRAGPRTDSRARDPQETEIVPVLSRDGVFRSRHPSAAVLPGSAGSLQAGDQAGSVAGRRLGRPLLLLRERAA